MSKFKKIILTVLCLIILLVPCLSINVFALQEVWFACDKPSVTENSGYVEVVCSQGNFVFVVYSGQPFSPEFYCEVDSSGYLYFYCADGTGNVFPCYSYYLTQHGKAIETPYWSSEYYSYFRTYDIYKINGYNVDVSQVNASVPEEPYSFYYAGDVIINDTLQQILGVLSANSGNAQQIINGINSNNNANTDKIIQKENENTDKVLNGDEDLDSSGETDKVDGTMGDIDNATSDAMGGKSDEQIQQEISGALDTDKIGLDFNKAQRISNFFDRTLETFGVSYKTLLLLSLCLGLSAFLIGRRYG